MKIEVSNGEIVDKYTILRIKSERVKDINMLQHVTKEFSYLESVLKEQKIDINDPLVDALYNINSTLWQIEDDIRIKESKQEFDEEFIRLARLVYRTNDERGRIKNQINEKTKSNFREVKNYANY